MYAIVGCSSSPLPALDATRVPVSPEAAPSSPAHADSRSRDDSRSGPGSDARASAPEAGEVADLPWLSPRHVGAAVRARHEDFQACQALGDLESRREDGAVTVGWLVLPDGTVNDVTIGPSTFQSTRINACVLGVAKQMTFPRSPAPTNISWTLEFRGASSHAPIATAH